MQTTENKTKNIESIYPLSPMQQGMLFHSIYTPNSGTYITQFSYTLKGQLNIPALKKAWQQIIERHTVLRTLFVWEKRETPLQIVRKTIELPWTYLDERNYSPTEKQERLQSFLTKDKQQGFELNKAPLMRCTLIHIEDNTYKFVWTLHHILMDGWCIPIILKEVSALYNANDKNEHIYLPSLRPYRDYINWLSTQNIKQAETFWRKVLQRFTAPTILHSTKGQGQEQHFHNQGIYDQQQLFLSPKASTSLQSLAQQHHLTLSTLIQGAWTLLLSHYSNESDIVFGCTVSGRPPTLSGVESMVGLFINTLPLRVKVDKEAQIIPWLHQLQEQQLEMQQCSYSPLVEVQGWSEIPRNLPLFESIVVFEKFPQAANLQAAENNNSIEIQDVYASEQTNYPLTVVAAPGEELLLRISYDTSRFDADAIQRMLGYLQNLLLQIIANPHQIVGDLSVLTEEERHQLLVTWNNTQISYPKNKCFHQLFEEQVQQTPDAIALVFEDQQITYAELNLRANQIANHLLSLGIKPQDLVGICLERSAEMLIGLLAILKAGAAYVPLDPNYPSDRLNYMLADAQVSVLLTNSQLLEQISINNFQVLCLDSLDKKLDSNNTKINQIVADINSDNLAYIIYTSGSTGKPKGVQISHKSLVNFLSAMRICSELTKSDNFLAVTTICFDIAALELYLPLILGGKVIIASRETTADGSQLLAKITEYNVTAVQATPVTWQMLLASGWPDNYPLKVFCGGEALSTALATKLLQTNSKVLNLYGPTETTIWSTFHKLEQNSHHTPHTIELIGRPIANTEIYILDDRLQPVPIGIPGSLYIGGAGVALGYLNRPELTQERFIPHPFKNDPKSRLYKTGDLAKYLANGNIEYIGRSDNQVKIRGFRIELGEIEAYITQNPLVQQAAVIIREDSGNDKYIVAYIVTAQEQSSTITNDLRSFLKHKLPDYMIPGSFVFLEALPLTPNGKIDRRALLATNWERTPSLNFIPPTNPTQNAIAKIFAEVLAGILPTEQVGIQDNFFELGGHSLKATQVVSRLRETFQVELPLRSLFEFPTVAELEIELKKYTENSQNAPNSTFTIEAIPRTTENLPLSQAQMRLWFIEEFTDTNSAYNIPVAVQITGALNINAFEQSLQKIVSRHEVLRTSYHTINGQPTQVISPTANITLPIINLEKLPDIQQKITLQQLTKQESQQPFDLKNSPLLRVKLIKLAENYYVLLTTMHHIVSDGWSMGIFIQELSALYTARTSQLTSNLTNPLPDLPIQYADFAAWQQKWLSESILQTQLDYWKKQLANTPPLLELPTDRPRKATQTFRGSSLSWNLDPDLTKKLKLFSQKSGATLFMTLMAAFATLLWRYTNQNDINIGTPIANRNRKEIEPLIGFFINTLVLRTQIQDNCNFTQLLKQVQQVTLDAYENQDVPFEQVVDTIQPKRNLSHSPLFQVMLVLQNANESLQASLPNLTLTPLPIETITSKFDLTLAIAETSSELICTWEYKTDLFDKQTIARMGEHFQNILTAIVTNPQQPISELPLLANTEKHQLLKEWNNTHTNYPRHKCIQQLFEEQVQLTPDAVAVVFENQQITYSELNIRANQLAHHLRSLGVKPEVKVGLLTGRSLEMILGLLGILKAGGAYVPLDPNYPQERLRYMLEDAEVSILLHQQHLAQIIPQNITKLVCIDAADNIISNLPQNNPNISSQIDNLAYVMYTSGSTGQPKGVSITHRGVVRLVKETNYISFNSQLNFLQLAPLTFDASTLEIWGSLLNGGKLVVMSDHKASLEELGQVIKKHSITTLWLTASLFHLMVDERLSDLEPVRQLLAGGDVLSLTHVQRVLHTLKQCCLINGYGPTENTTFTCCAPMTAKTQLENSVPIGRPIANTQTYILDSNLQVSLIGVWGELYIGGDGLARNYQNRPDLTAEKFIPNPFSQTPGERLYKTGDLVRYLANGNIEFFSRIDNQVKIRGFRIELGEIETALSRHPQIQQVAVIARSESTAEKYLVAYIVPKSEAPTATELQSFLQQKLPNYMLPAAFVFLDALPLTANGKLERSALPAPNWLHNSSVNFVSPCTPTQQVIANIITEILSLQQIGIHDNFFEMGGHSLNATQVVSRLRETFSVEFPLRYLFEYPTVAELDECIYNLRQTEFGLQIPAIKPIPRDTENIPLSWTQSRLWFIEQLQGATATYNIRVAVQFTGSFDTKAFERSFQEVVQRHEVLRTSYHQVNGQAVQVISPDPEVILPIIDLQSLIPDKQLNFAINLATSITQQPFDLEKSPLVRMSVLKLSPQSHILVLSMHHIVSDGWSMGIFVQELSTLYTAFTSPQINPINPLPELAIQYADFAVWQQKCLLSQVKETQLNYWKKQLTGAPPLLELPTDKPRGVAQSISGNRWEFQLTPICSEKLKILSQKSKVTLFMTLLTAFAILLRRYTNQNDINIGTPIANRNRKEIEPLIGAFVNTLVLRTQIKDNLSFMQLLDQVKQVTLEAYENQDVPFEQVVEALQPERNLNHSPLFQVLFALQNSPIGELEIPDLSINYIPVETLTSKFDLTLSMAETSQGLKASFEYKTDLFNQDTIARMADNFQTMLLAISENPEQLISKLPLLFHSEEHKLLEDWNNTEKEYPHEKCIHKLFEEQVKRTPDSIALVFAEEQITYFELNKRANQLANYLQKQLQNEPQKQEVKTEISIGICMERSIEMVVGLLAILKAGCAYIPLDPNYPKERLQYMLYDANISLLLVSSSFYNSNFDNTIITNTKVVNLDEENELISSYCSENININIKPNDLAYVIYTSGSTGKPKGAMNEHQGICNRLLWMQETYQLNQSDRILQKTPFSFDVSVWEFFWTLITGACLVIAKPDGHKDANYLVNLIIREKITTIHFVPSMLEVFLEQPSLSNCNSLQRVICSGEALTLELERRFFTSLKCELHNLYGPTEAAIDVTSWQCINTINTIDYSPTDITENPQNLITPIGRPIANTQIYILDTNLQPVPIGVSGELYIGGIGVARGYLNRQDLTAEKFIPNPFKPSKFNRLYKTGDLARYLPDGNIQYLNRIDFQVKVRGFRIELGEIETVLTTHPELQQAVVVAKENTKGDKSLIAYIVPKDKSPNTNELRSFLQQKLPDYMIPSNFILLSTLPLTPNGKLDRKNLPELEKSSKSSSFIAPRDHLEIQLIQIWSEILEIKPIGIKDNFFELGGHSLLAVRLMAQIHSCFGQNLPLGTLFQYPTIEKLANILRKKADFSIWSPLVPIQPKGKKPPFFCVPGAGGNAIYLHQLGSYFDADQPFYSLQPLGLDGESQPHQRIEDMAAYYIKAIQTVQPEGPYLLGGHSLGGKIAFEMATQLHSEGQEVALLSIIDSPAPLAELNEPFWINWNDAKWLTEIAKVVANMFSSDIEVSYSNLEKLQPEEQLKYFQQQLEASSLLPPEFSITQLQGLVEVFKAGHKIDYAPKQIYTNKITLFRSRETFAANATEDSTWGWDKLTTEPVDVHFVPGDHHTMMSEPQVQTLANSLKEHMLSVKYT